MKSARDTHTHQSSLRPQMRGVMRTRFLWDSRDSYLLSEAKGRVSPPPTICLFATYSRAGCGAVGFEAYTACIRRWTPLDKGGYAGVMSNILLPLSPLLRTLLLHIAWHNLVWRGYLMGSGVAPFASWPPFFGRIKGVWM